MRSYAIRVLAPVVLLGSLVTTSHAETVCRTKSGVLVSRAKCKKREVTINAPLTPDGNLGLGTTAPAAMLDVDGPAIFHDSVSVSSSQTIGGGLTVGGSTTFGGPVTFAGGQTFPNIATLGANTFVGDQMIGGDVILTARSVLGSRPRMRCRSTVPRISRLRSSGRRQPALLVAHSRCRPAVRPWGRRT